MNKQEILKKMLPGLLPIIVYIIADEIFGTKIGIIVAVVFGLVELIYIYIKEKQIDKFVITDTLLLILLGVISILLENDSFFKLKPAFIELLFCAVLGVSAFSSKNIMLLMSKRYMKGVEVNKQVEQKLKNNSKVLFWIFLAHTVLIIYAVYYMSDKAWAFISTALLYIILGIYFVFEILKARFSQKRNSI